MCRGRTQLTEEEIMTRNCEKSDDQTSYIDDCTALWHGTSRVSVLFIGEDRLSNTHFKMALILLLGKHPPTMLQWLVLFQHQLVTLTELTAGNVQLQKASASELPGIARKEVLSSGTSTSTALSKHKGALAGRHYFFPQLGVFTPGLFVFLQLLNCNRNYIMSSYRSF